MTAAAAAVCQWDMMSTSAVCQHDSEQLDMTCELLFINCFSLPTYCKHWQDDADFTGSILSCEMFDASASLSDDDLCC